MRFDENLRQFVYEYEGIIFAWDEEPGKDFPDTVKKLAAGYYERLDDIVRHIAPRFERNVWSYGSRRDKEETGETCHRPYDGRN